MPLFHIMGVSPTHQSLSLCFCFMQKETKDDYIWALQETKKCLCLQESNPTAIITDRELSLMNALTEVFPDSKNLICIWHIEKNLLSNVKKHFDTENWNRFLKTWKRLCNSTTLEDFTNTLNSLKADIPVLAYRYIESTWLPQKEKFILFWTKDVMHYVHTVTSRVESGHANIKRCSKF